MSTTPSDLENLEWTYDLNLQPSYTYIYITHSFGTALNNHSLGFFDPKPSDLAGLYYPPLLANLLTGWEIDRNPTTAI